MSANIEVAGCLTTHPKEKSFSVAGLELINRYGRVTTTHFELRILKSELVAGARPGDTPHITARLQPPC